MFKKILIFLIFFLEIKTFNKYEFLNRDNTNLITYIVNLLYFSYERSNRTIIFWELIYKYINELNNNIQFTLNRMRNPSKNLNKNLENLLIKININELFIETNNIYDLYANLLNNAYDQYLINTEELNFIDKLRIDLRNKSLDIINSVIKIKDNIQNNICNFNNIHRGVLSKLNESINLISEKLKIKELIYSCYVESDKSICDLYNKYIVIEDMIYNQYKNYYSTIEKFRKEFYKKEYNELMNNILIKNKNYKFKKIIKIDNSEIKFSDTEFLPFCIE